VSTRMLLSAVHHAAPYLHPRTAQRADGGGWWRRRRQGWHAPSVTTVVAAWAGWVLLRAGAGRRNKRLGGTSSLREQGRNVAIVTTAGESCRCPRYLTEVQVALVFRRCAKRASKYPSVN
jgi:hypothetical protein